MTDPQLCDEEGRLAALLRYQVLDSGPEKPFDKITELVKLVFDVPICAITLIDRDRQWIKSIRGLDVKETPRSESFCTHAVGGREPLIIRDARADPRFADNAAVTGALNIRSYVGAPLRSPDGYNLGALCVLDTRPRDFDATQIQILKHFASLVMGELELRTIAERDHLTGALTRRGFRSQVDREIARYQRHGRVSALLVFDIDHFKAINDRYGHPIGDAVLTSVTSACEQVIRPSDALGRLGGEEFGIIMSETTAREGLLAAERFRKAVERLRFTDQPDLRVSASFGVAPISSARCSPDRWLSDADEAMYLAKREGRNRVCTAQERFEVAGGAPAARSIARVG